MGRRRRPAVLALGADPAQLRPPGRAEALAAAAGPQAGLLAQLLPELGAGLGDFPPEAGEPAGPGARFALFDAVCTVLDEASRPAPLVVVLDDLHAAGRPTILLLRFAASARLPRVLLVATYRTAEAALDPAVSDVINGLESASPPLALTGLTAGDVRLLLPGADAAMLADVQRRGDGNPLFVSQVARLLGHGAATVADVPVPAGIRQAVRRLIARLAVGGDGPGLPAAAEVLATAAALGPGIDPALVAAVLGTGAGSVARLCDQATAIGLLHPGQDASEVYRFGHALIRETLYAEFAPQARAEVHGRIAAILEKTAGRSNSELAHHFLRAAPAVGEAAGRAVHYSQLAGQDALTVLAWEEAAGHFRRALDIQQRAVQATAASRCELLLNLAGALTITGPDPAAAKALAEAVQLARRAGEPRLLATAARAANEFAANLLMPATMVRRAAATTIDVADLALQFQVSRAAMGFRLTALRIS